MDAMNVFLVESRRLLCWTADANQKHFAGVVANLCKLGSMLVQSKCLSWWSASRSSAIFHRYSYSLQNNSSCFNRDRVILSSSRRRSWYSHRCLILIHHHMISMLIETEIRGTGRLGVSELFKSSWFKSEGQLWPLCLSFTHLSKRQRDCIVPGDDSIEIIRKAISGQNAIIV